MPIAHVQEIIEKCCVKCCVKGKSNLFCVIALFVLQKYSLDITGPILPGNFSRLCKLFESTQQNQFSAVIKNLQATAPFNVLPPGTQEQLDNVDEKIFEQPSTLGTTNLTFIKFDDGLYSWETN